MKRLALLLLPLLLYGCTVSEPRETMLTPSPSPSQSIKPVEWEIERTPAPTPIPTPEHDGADEWGFFEIDIDEMDGYQDFVMEHRYSDAYYGTRFYRLKDGEYVELGYMDGVVTGKLSYSRVPNIMVEGSGVIYAIERSKLASWAKIARAYRVENDALVQVPPENIYDGGAMEHIKDAPVFEVTEPVTVYDTKDEKTRTLAVGELISFEYSNEIDKLFAPYFPPGSNEDRLIVLEIDSIDCIKNGPFFGDCFYNERVEWVG